MIVVYNKMTKKELENSLNDTIERLRCWFQDNPKRRTCRAKLWFGHAEVLKRKTWEKQVRDYAATVKTKD